MPERSVARGQRRPSAAVIRTSSQGGLTQASLPSCMETIDAHLTRIRPSSVWQDTRPSVDIMTLGRVCRPLLSRCRCPDAAGLGLAQAKSPTWQGLRDPRSRGPPDFGTVHLPGGHGWSREDSWAVIAYCLPQEQQLLD